MTKYAQNTAPPATALSSDAELSTPAAAPTSSSSPFTAAKGKAGRFRPPSTASASAIPVRQYAAGIALDKDLTKRLLRFAGVDTADWLRFDGNNQSDDTDEYGGGKYSNHNGRAEKILREIGIPCVIKPLTGGSSCGVTIVRKKEELGAAIALAEKYQSDFIAEKFIPGRELTVGVLEDPETRRARALPAVEIIPRVGGYDYVNKYQSGATAEICPAQIPEDIAQRAAKIAETVHRALGLRGYSRTDIIYDESTGRLVTLEVNTSPGMTDTSLIPLEAKAAGISFPRLCEIIATL